MCDAYQSGVDGTDCLSPDAQKCTCNCVINGEQTGEPLYGCSSCTYFNGAFLAFYCGTGSAYTCQNSQNCNYGKKSNSPCPVMDEVYSANIQVSIWGSDLYRVCELNKL